MRYTPSLPVEHDLMPGPAGKAGLPADNSAMTTTRLATRHKTRPCDIACLFVSLWLASCAHAADRLDLEGTTITGSQELPKALHIVPWKPSESGELAARPMNSLVDEILAPVDRDVFLRELEYYEAVHSSK